MLEWFVTNAPFAAWFGALAGGGALVINWLNRNDAVRERKKAERAKQPWVAFAIRGRDPGFVTLRAEFHNPTGGEFRITEVIVRKPRGTSIKFTHHPSTGVENVAAGSRSADVSWPVWMPGARGDNVGAGVGDFRLALPRGDRPRWSSGSDKAHVAIEMLFKGVSAPPSRDPIRIVAKATIPL